MDPHAFLFLNETILLWDFPMRRRDALILFHLLGLPKRDVYFRSALSCPLPGEPPCFPLQLAFIYGALVSDTPVHGQKMLIPVGSWVPKGCQN